MLLRPAVSNRRVAAQGLRRDGLTSSGPLAKYQSDRTGYRASMAEAVVQSTKLLRTRLEEEGVARATPERFVSGKCLLECTLFEWFLHQAVIVLEFGPHPEAIRQALAGRILIDLCWRVQHRLPH